MIIFANPLGFGLLDRYATLVHERHDLVDEFPELGSVGLIRRRPKASEVSPFAFSCYRSTRDVPPDWQAFDVEDPFPRPVQRVVRTSRRGMFRISLRGPVAEEIVPE